MIEVDREEKPCVQIHDYEPLRFNKFSRHKINIYIYIYKSIPTKRNLDRVIYLEYKLTIARSNKRSEGFWWIKLSKLIQNH